MSGSKTIKDVVEILDANLITAKRTDGTPYVCLKERIDWQRDIIRKAHLDRFPSDNVYSRIQDIVSALRYDLTPDCGSSQALDIVLALEGDVFNYDLTKWLHDDVRNIKYLDQALKNEVKDGWRLLSCAQQIYIHEIGEALLDAIEEYIDN